MIVRIKQVDAFTSLPFGGNPAGVVTDANNLSDEQMQKIAKEMNLSETAFVSRSGNADFKVRFFTPRFEVDLCGHATIGTFAALHEEGALDVKKNIFYQETKAGILPVETEAQNGRTLFMMTQVPPVFGQADVEHIPAAALLGVDKEHLSDMPVQIVSTGIPWLLIGVKSLEHLSGAKPDLPAIKDLSKRLGIGGIVSFCMEAYDEDCHYHSRTFAPYAGVDEDPVCGTGNACVASYIGRYNLIESSTEKLELVGEQGHEVGRPGRVYAEIIKGINGISGVRIGGHAVTVMEGEMRF